MSATKINWQKVGKNYTEVSTKLKEFGYECQGSIDIGIIRVEQWNVKGADALQCSEPVIMLDVRPTLGNKCFIYLQQLELPALTSVTNSDEESVIE